jgi:ABC-type multidrug transport system ATPase subunit
MASKGKVVVCTVHQPSSQVFAMFDHVLLMAEGRTAFMGPTSKALEFFSSQVITY